MHRTDTSQSEQFRARMGSLGHAWQVHIAQQPSWVLRLALGAVIFVVVIPLAVLALAMALVAFVTFVTVALIAIILLKIRNFFAGLFGRGRRRDGRQNVIVISRPD